MNEEIAELRREVSSLRGWVWIIGVAVAIIALWGGVAAMGVIANSLKSPPPMQSGPTQPPVVGP